MSADDAVTSLEGAGMVLPVALAAQNDSPVLESFDDRGRLRHVRVAVKLLRKKRK